MPVCTVEACAAVPPPAPSAPVEETLSNEQMVALYNKLRASERGEYALQNEERQALDRMESSRNARWRALREEVPRPTLKETPLVMAQALAPPVSIRHQAEDGSITLPIPEELRWKLAYLELKREKALEAVVAPLRQQYAEALKRACDQALTVSPEYRAAVNAVNSASNEALDVLEKLIPSTHAVVTLNHEQGFAQAVVNPEMHSKRFLIT